MSSFLECEAARSSGLMSILDGCGEEVRFEPERSTKCTMGPHQMPAQVFDKWKVALFFRVEHFQPSLLKIARGDLSEKFTSSNVTISTFTSVPGPDRRVFVEPLHMSGCSGSIMDFPLLVLSEAFFEAEHFKLYKMECSDKVAYSMPALPQGRSNGMRKAIELMINADAVPGSRTGQATVPTDDADRVDMLRSLLLLRQAGYVEAVGDPCSESDSVGWRLTSSGMAQVVVGNVLSKPKPVLKPHTSLPVAEWSVFELLLHLRTQRWQGSPWQRGHRRPEPILLPDVGAAAGSAGAFLDAEQKRWYYRPFEAKVSASYLRALVHADRYGPTLQARGVRRIPHAATNRYYETIVGIALGLKTADDLPDTPGMTFEREGRPRSPAKKRRRLDGGPRDAALAGGALTLEADGVAASAPEPPPGVGDLSAEAAEGGAGERRGRGERHEKSQYWGNFTIVYRPATANKKGKLSSAAWEATCPAACHNVGGKTRCKKTMSFKTDCEESAEQVTLWRIRHWCNMAVFAPSKKEHMKYHPLLEDLPDEDAILKSQLPDDWVGEDVQSFSG